MQNSVKGRRLCGYLQDPIGSLPSPLVLAVSSRALHLVAGVAFCHVSLLASQKVGQRFVQDNLLIKSDKRKDDKPELLLGYHADDALFFAQDSFGRRVFEAGHVARPLHEALCMWH